MVALEILKNHPELADELSKANTSDGWDKGIFNINYFQEKPVTFLQRLRSRPKFIGSQPVFEEFEKEMNLLVRRMMVSELPLPPNWTTMKRGKLLYFLNLKDLQQTDFSDPRTKYAIY